MSQSEGPGLGVPVDWSHLTVFPASLLGALRWAMRHAALKEPRFSALCRECLTEADLSLLNLFSLLILSEDMQLKEGSGIQI